MKVKVLMATLVITLLVGVQGFANPCDSACVDPCAACGTKGANLFSGLKKLVNGVRFNGCDPCDAVTACNPCDETAFCNPCDDVACDLPRINLGGRLRNLFANSACSPCDAITDCTPCDYAANCDPCGVTDGCCAPKFAFRNLFSGLRLRGCATDCGPCDIVGDCGPCDYAANCGPCDDVCGDYCGPRGHLFDLPRIRLTKLFSGLGGCNDGMCNPCDAIQPCDSVNCR